MQSEIELEGWKIVQVEIKFKDGEPVSEKAVYESAERPRMLRTRKISVSGSLPLTVLWETTNKIP